MNEADFAETVPSPEEIGLKAEIETVVRQAIGTLQGTDRKLMEARYIKGASYDRLRVESGLSYAAVANRLKRAKQKVRRRIEKLLGGVVYHHTFESNSVAVNEEEILQVIIEALENNSGNTITRVFEHRLGKSLLYITEGPQLIEEELKQKIASGEFVILPPIAGPTPSTSTESQPNPTHSVLTPSDPTVESTTTPSETSEGPTSLSDEEWAEFERLLGTAAEGETSQRDKQAPLNAERQQQIEKAIEEPPVDPAVRQGMRRQRRFPLERVTGMPPHEDR